MKRSAALGAPLSLRLAASLFLIGEAAPFAPATFASLAVTPLLFGIIGWPNWVQAAILVVVVVVGVRVSTRAEAVYGHDGGAIVIDEVAGMLVTFLAVPAVDGTAGRWVVLGLGFFLFRIFDILKPFPVGWAQNLPRGWGVMTDDLLAGVYANLVLRLVVTL